MRPIGRAVPFALLAAVLFAAWFCVVLCVPVGGGGETRFFVAPGASPRVVAAELKAKGLIRSSWAFHLAAAWGDGWRQARAGEYALRRDLSAIDILRTIERGQVVSEWVTVSEGLALWQVANLVEASGLGSADEFLRAAHSPGDFEAGFPLPNDSLEGYLFPDTYNVPRHPGAVRDLVKMMLARFDEVVWRQALGGQAPHSSLHQVITLASLVEGEAKLDAERPVIAAVLINRLKRGMKLDCDATVQYALGPNRKERLGYGDLAIASPYNTYLHPGLPPGPINSPGRASIEAAVHPADASYLFYVARADGSHIFSRTYREHLRAVARVRAARALHQAASRQQRGQP
jgi:UPF0755 protein